MKSVLSVLTFLVLFQFTYGDKTGISSSWSNRQAQDSGLFTEFDTERTKPKKVSRNGLRKRRNVLSKRRMVKKMAEGENISHPEPVMPGNI